MVPFTIRTPGELGKAMRIVHANLRDGTLDQVEAGEFASKGRFLDVVEDGPWEDVLHYRFSCIRCGQAFDLTAETYHGGGGEWAPHNQALQSDGRVGRCAPSRVRR